VVNWFFCLPTSSFFPLKIENLQRSPGLEIESPDFFGGDLGRSPPLSIAIRARLGAGT
jgi:hypothetical protein